MSRSIIGWLAAAVLAVVAGAFAYVFYFAGGSGEPSTDLTTPDVAASATGAEAGDPGGSTIPATTIQTFVDETAYALDQDRTTASFEIGEVLRGEPQTVVGTTNEVVGQVVVDRSDLGASRFSDMIVNARTFTTDSDRRDRTIRGPVILDSASDEHELITFSATSVDGLDGLQARVGESYVFRITGDLTIKGTTNPVTFAVDLEMPGEGTIEGTATAEVSRTDFDIGIPSVPFVADVTDEVMLRLDFVATTG